MEMIVNMRPEQYLEIVLLLLANVLPTVYVIFYLKKRIKIKLLKHIIIIPVVMYLMYCVYNILSLMNINVDTRKYTTGNYPSILGITIILMATTIYLIYHHRMAKEDKAEEAKLKKQY